MGPTAYVAPGAYVDPGARVASGVWIGPSGWVDEDAVLLADSVITSAAHIGKSAHIGRAALVGPRTRIGAGDHVRDNVRVDHDVVVPVGAIVRLSDRQPHAAGAGRAGSSGLSVESDSRVWPAYPATAATRLPSPSTPSCSAEPRREALNTGEMPDYQLVAARGRPSAASWASGGSPASAWPPHFGTQAVAGAIERIPTGGGTVHHGPAEVPGGALTAVAPDPQGAWFAVLGPQAE